MFEDIDKNVDDKISKEELCDFFRENVVHENKKCHEHEFQKRAKDLLLGDYNIKYPSEVLVRRTSTLLKTKVSVEGK